MAACLYPAVRFVKRVGQRRRERVVTPCGVCLACRVGKASQWGARVSLELLSWPVNHPCCSLTLTYAEDRLPQNRSLVKRHLQDFWGRLRHHTPHQLRYLSAGEYSDPPAFRPHYHVCLLGFYPSDSKFFSYASGNPQFPLYTSARLDRIWRFGAVFIGALNFATAVYAAKYTVKRQSDDRQFYLDRGLEPPFVEPSRRPGLGRLYLEEHSADLRNDRIQVAPGIIQRVPDFIYHALKEVDPNTYYLLSARRRAAAANFKPGLGREDSAEVILTQRVSRRAHN